MIGEIWLEDDPFLSGSGLFVGAFAVSFKERRFVMGKFRIWCHAPHLEDHPRTWIQG